MADLSTTISTVFPKKKIVLLGDLVADQFLHGTISRVSREAPVFILKHDETETLPGGAANAAANIAALGGKPILVGVMGSDLNGRLLSERLSATNVDHEFVIHSDAVSTTTKVRVLAGQHYAPRQQVIRIDYENRADLGADILERLRTGLEQASMDADAIVISDYGYGVAAPFLIDDALKLSEKNGIPLVVDSRFRLRGFAGATTAAPNQEEVEAILGKDFTDVDCEKLRHELRFRSLLVTRGNKGMLLVEKNKSPVRMPAIGGLEPVDVTGAGDTVIAVYALGVASGLSYADAAHIANHAGGIVVMKKGTATVSMEELLRSIQSSGEEKASEAF